MSPRELEVEPLDGSDWLGRKDRKDWRSHTRSVDAPHEAPSDGEIDKIVDNRLHSILGRPAESGDKRPMPRELAGAVAPDGGPVDTAGLARWVLEEWLWDNYPPEAILRWESMEPTYYSPSREDLHLVFLPGGRPESIALIKYYNCEYPDPVAGPLGLAQAVRDWHDEYGADPISSEGTNLWFHVDRPPTTFDQAVSLAIEHCDIGTDQFALGGRSLGEYATSLVRNEYWELTTHP